MRPPAHPNQADLCLLDRMLHVPPRQAVAAGELGLGAGMAAPPARGDRQQQDDGATAGGALSLMQLYLAGASDTEQEARGTGEEQQQQPGVEAAEEEEDGRMEQRSGGSKAAQRRAGHARVIKQLLLCRQLVAIPSALPVCKMADGLALWADVGNQLASTRAARMTAVAAARHQTRRPCHHHQSAACMRTRSAYDIRTCNRGGRRQKP